MKEPFVLGIAGGNGSGKTTVIEEITRDLPQVQYVVLNQRMYTKERPANDQAPDLDFPYDHPQSYDMEALANDVEALRRGESVEIPQYDEALGMRKKERLSIEPRDCIILEGNHILFDPRVRELLDFRVFIQTSPDVRLIRLLLREIQKGGNIESFLLDYMTTGRRNHETFVEPSKIHAHMIIPEGGKNRMAMDLLMVAFKERWKDSHA